jgi:hypothetical protein
MAPLPNQAGKTTRVHKQPPGGLMWVCDQDWLAGDEMVNIFYSQLD